MVIPFLVWMCLRKESTGQSDFVGMVIIGYDLQPRVIRTGLNVTFQPLRARLW